MGIEQVRKKERELALEQWKIRQAQGAAKRAEMAQAKEQETAKEKRDEGKDRGAGVER